MIIFRNIYDYYYWLVSSLFNVLYFPFLIHSELAIGTVWSHLLFPSCFPFSWVQAFISCGALLYYVVTAWFLRTYVTGVADINKQNCCLVINNITTPKENHRTRELNKDGEQQSRAKTMATYT